MFSSQNVGSFPFLPVNSQETAMSEDDDFVEMVDNESTDVADTESTETVNEEVVMKVSVHNITSANNLRVQTR